jgi:uroporphyrinogen decarboxylase
MRQAGRFLPEYREIRAQAGSFLDLCYNSQQAAEVTLQPVKRFDMDAAILFSDILVIPHALGRNLSFVQGEGPKLDPLDASQIASLRSAGAMDRLSPVFETVSRVRRQLASEKSLIGFCGGPWTVATYMIAGRGTPDQGPARLFAERHRVEFAALIDRLVDVSAEYLIGQARAGADVLQIFDSWVGVLGEQAFQSWCLEPTKKLVSQVRAAVPGVPIIGFPKGAGLYLKRYAQESGVDGIGIDWTVPVEFAQTELQPHVAVQGNLDPLTLIVGGKPMATAVTAILKALAGGRMIFNLGHGIRPETPIRHVEELVKQVKGYEGPGADG